MDEVKTGGLITFFCLCSMLGFEGLRFAGRLQSERVTNYKARDESPLKAAVSSLISRLVIFLMGYTTNF